MEIIFDDSFRFLSNTQKQEDEIPTRISSLGSIILENVRVAVTTHVQDEFNKYKSATPADRLIILKGVLNDTTVVDADKEWFQNRIQAMGGSGGGSGWNAQSDDIQGTAIKESDIVGEAGADVGSILKLKEAVLARLRMRGISDQKINDILVLFMEKIMLPFSETIKILDYLLEESLKARVDPVDMIEFWAYHYQEKRSQGLTKSIIDQAVKLQEINPSINIFNLLKNAAIGNQAEVGKVILIKDPDARLVVNNLISLSQSALPEQAEQVRRNFQFSRDALNNYQEKLRIQKALFDMMKTEEMNRNLSIYIADTSAIFKSLISQPLFRALRDVFYDLQASKILLNTYSSLVTDTQPLTPRVSPREEQESPGSGLYQNPNLPQRISSRFVPLKKNNLVIAQNTQTNTGAFPITVGTGATPIFGPQGLAAPDTLRTSTNPITGQQNFTGTLPDPKTQGTLGYASKIDIKGMIGSMEEVKKNIIAAFGQVNEIFHFVLKFLVDAVSQILEKVRQGVTNLIQEVTDAFSNAVKNITNFFKNNFNNIKNSVTKFLEKGSGDTANIVGNTQEKLIKLAQGTPQATMGGYGAQTWGGGGISIAVLALITILGIRTLGPAIRGLASLNNISEIINLILPGALAIRNIVIEFAYQFWDAGDKAPNSSQYYDRAGRFTAEGQRRLYNNQQTRVTLGINTKEDLALARAEKQRSENMATVRTQLEILQKSMDQSVYLGGKTDVAPANIPGDLQNKVNEFLKLCKSVQDANQAEYLILKKAIDRVSASFDPVQKIQAQNLLSSVRNDIASLQGIISEYSSSAVVMEHIQRKRKLQMVLGPTLKRMQALEGLGISKSALITGKNGVLAQLSRIRHEEALALQKLRKEYQEKMQLLDNPDIAQKEFAFPVDTKATKLPLPPLPPTAPTSA
jgi:hypothetical protein